LWHRKDGVQLGFCFLVEDAVNSCQLVQESEHFTGRHSTVCIDIFAIAPRVSEKTSLTVAQLQAPATIATSPPHAQLQRRRRSRWKAFTSLNTNTVRNQGQALNCLA